MNHRIFRIVAILASATLFALAAAIEQPTALLVWIVLTPWLASLDREQRMGATLVSGLFMASAFVVVVFAWFAPAVARYSGVSPVISAIMLVVGAPLLQPQFVAFAAFRRFLQTRGLGVVGTSLGGALSWVGCEWLCPRLFEDSLGHGLYAFDTVRQGADIAGVLGLTFVIVLVNDAVYQALRSARSAPRRALLAASTAAALVGLLTAYGTLRLHQIETAPSQAAPLRVALVQANLDDYEGLRHSDGTFMAVRRILDRHETLSLDALYDSDTTGPLDLLVWPETVYPTTYGRPKSPAGAEFDEEIRRFVSKTGASLIFGTYDRSGDREFNAAVLLQSDKHGDVHSLVYTKRHLFPLTEYVPPWLDRPAIRESFPWLGTWQPGYGIQILDLKRPGGDSLRVAPLICLDAVDSSLALEAAANGADLIVTLSNDGWFADSPGAMLHLVVSAFRSIETRLPQLRVTNTGISAVISATGEIVSFTDVGVATVLRGQVTPGARSATLMTTLGNWFGPSAALAALLLGIASSRLA